MDGWWPLAIARGRDAQLRVSSIHHVCALNGQVFLGTSGLINGALAPDGIPASIQAVYGRNAGSGPGELHPDNWHTEDLPAITKAFCQATGLPRMPVVRAALAFDAGWSDKDREVSQGAGGHVALHCASI